MDDAIKAFVCALMVGFAFIPDPSSDQSSEGTRVAVALIAIIWVVYWASRVIHFLNR